MLKKIILSLFLLYAILGFIVIPYVAKPQIIEIVAKETNAKIDIQSIYFNPFIFKLKVSGLTLSVLDDTELLYLKSILLDVELYSLINSAVHIKEFIIEEPRISLVLDKNKKINLASIAKETDVEVTKADDANTSIDIPRIIIDKIAIVNGSINYEDYSHKSKFDFTLDSLGFELNDIDTADINSSDAKIKFYTSLNDGGFLDFRSEVLRYEPLTLSGSLEYEASKLYSKWKYIQDNVNIEVGDGKLYMDTKYYLNIDDLNATKLSDLNIAIEKLRLKPKGDFKDILTLDSLSIQNGTIKPFAQDIHLEKIALNALDVKVRRDKKKNIDWIEYTKVDFSSDTNETKVQTDETTTTEVPRPWNVVVDAIALEQIKVSLIDEGIRPRVDTTLNDFNLYFNNVTLLGKKPLSYKMNLVLNDKFKCKSKGEIVHNVLDINSYIKCSGFDVTHYKPYIDTIARSELEVYDINLRRLTLGFDANLSVKDIDSEIVVDVSDANVNLNKFALNKRSTNKRLVSFNAFRVKGITLNTKEKEVFVKNTQLVYLNMKALRDEEGNINVDGLIVPKKKKLSSKKIKKSKQVKKKSEDYRVRLKKVQLIAAKMSFDDAKVSPSVESVVDGMYMTFYNIDSKKYTWIDYSFETRVNEVGKVKSKGRLRHTPLKYKGKLSLDNISLTELTPYIQEHAYLSLIDGSFDLDTNIKYSESKENPDVNIEGSFQLKELFVNHSEDNTSLLSLGDIHLKKFTLELLPNRLFIDELDVDSFYVNALIDANKTLNFTTLAKNSEVNASDVNTSVVETNASQSEPFPVKIVKVMVSNGSANFADESLPINFKTNIHDLNGEIFGISTMANETSYIDIKGEIDRYGSTKLKGSVNSSNPKAYTDLAFNFRNLDLVSASGYSSSFIGYKIDSGKLFLNLNYDIKDSQLFGKNSIIVKNIELSEVPDAENVTSIPLGFVIALLEDSDGIIDIDMPIEGNVDEPDFKYGALVWKTLGSLMLKAVASPFKFLGSMMGVDSDDLEYAEFEAGTSVMLPSEQEKLDNVAKLLIKRPKISLSIAGGYNIEDDTKSIQKEKLINLVAQLSGAKNEKEKINAMTIDLLEEIYEDARDDDKLDKLEDSLEKKYEKEDEYQRAYQLALVKLCSDVQEVKIEELHSLAKNRTQSIKTYLVDLKGIAGIRINELEILEVPSEENNLIQSKLEVVIQ